MRRPWLTHRMCRQGAYSPPDFSGSLRPFYGKAGASRPCMMCGLAPNSKFYGFLPWRTAKYAKIENLGLLAYRSGCETPLNSSGYFRWTGASRPCMMCGLAPNSKILAFLPLRTGKYAKIEDFGTRPHNNTTYYHETTPLVLMGGKPTIVATLPIGCFAIYLCI